MHCLRVPVILPYDAQANHRPTKLEAAAHLLAKRKSELEIPTANLIEWVCVARVYSTMDVII